MLKNKNISLLYGARIEAVSDLQNEFVVHPVKP
jgi:hypothetical protein